MRKYKGFNIEGRKMFAAVYGIMNDGTFVYVECDKDGNWIEEDDQYIRCLLKADSGKNYQIFLQM